MSINFGRAPNPGYYVMGIIIPLGRPVEPEREQLDSMPGYVVNGLPGKPDQLSRNGIVSVHTFAPTYAEAMAAAEDADYLIRCTSSGDVITLPGGAGTAKGVVGPSAPPAWIDYRDPNIKRVYANYPIELRFT